MLTCLTSTRNWVESYYRRHKVYTVLSSKGGLCFDRLWSIVEFPKTDIQPHTNPQFQPHLRPRTCISLDTSFPACKSAAWTPLPVSTWSLAGWCRTPGTRAASTVRGISDCRTWRCRCVARRTATADGSRTPTGWKGDFCCGTIPELSRWREWMSLNWKALGHTWREGVDPPSFGKQRKHWEWISKKEESGMRVLSRRNPIEIDLFYLKMKNFYYQKACSIWLYYGWSWAIMHIARTLLL